MVKSNQNNDYYTDALLCSYVYGSEEYLFDDTPYEELNHIIRDIKTLEDNLKTPNLEIDQYNIDNIDYTFDDGHYYYKNAGALVKEDDNNLYLIFRGTDSIADTKQYFNFRSHYLFFQPLVDSVLNYHDKNPDKKLRIAGHSLGGAMVNHTVSNYLECLEQNANFSAVTFGTPGTRLDPELPIIHFTHKNDGISHIADLIYDKGNQKVIINKDDQINSLFSHFSEEYAYSMKQLQFKEEKLKKQFKQTKDSLPFNVEHSLFGNITMMQFYSVHLKDSFKTSFKHFNNFVSKKAQEIKKTYMVNRLISRKNEQRQNTKSISPDQPS